jgi:ribosomal small subunit protein bTHX
MPNKIVFYRTFSRNQHIVSPFMLTTMGKGDRRSRRGKIYAGSYGKRRSRKGKKKSK